MKGSILTLVVAGLLAGCPVSSIAVTLNPQATPSDLAEAVDAARRVGHQIFLFDKAASDANDAIIRFTGGRPDPRVGGWLVERKAGDLLVTFFKEAGGHLSPVYRVRPTGGSSVEAAEASAVATDAEASMWRARKTALATNFTRCANSYNTVVLPGDVAGRPGWLVYLLPAGSPTDALLVGGYYRVEVSRDGERALDTMAFAKTCLAVSTKADPARGTVIGLYFTHLLSDAPAESHVFLSERRGQPLFVGTPRGVWKVTADEITFMGKAE